MNNRTKAVRLSPLHSVVFSCIFQDEKKAGPAMREFLNAILMHVGEESIVKILSMNSEYSVFGESANEKYGRLDVRVKAESGRIFDIEVQIKRDDMNERGFFYGGRVGFHEFETSTPYGQMPEVRVINILDFYVRKDHSNVVEPVVLSYANNPEELATRKFIMYHIQLPAFRREHPTFESVKGDAFLTWLYMLDRGYKEESEMEMIAGLTDGLKNFAERYNISINDPDLLRKYWMITDGERDVSSRIYYAVREAKKEAIKKGEKKGEKIGEKRGEKIGEKRGERKAHLEDARRMMAESIDADIIYRVTGISVEELERSD